MPRRKLGLWIIGARGGVAATVCVGLSALKKGLADNQGLVSQLPYFSKLDLASFGDFTIGGHEIRGASLHDSA
jgi:myo-inositol-1-phosphate synthase